MTTGSSEFDELESVLLADRLIKEGHEIFRSGRQHVLECLQNERADIILLDMGFSDVDLEVVPDLLSAGARVIVASGASGESWMDEAFSKGAFGCLKKPVSLKELEMLIAAVQVYSYHTPEARSVVLVDCELIWNAEKLIESCEHCNPEGARLPFDQIFDEVTGSDPSVTDYLLERPANCPNCRRAVLEKTLVEVV